MNQEVTKQEEHLQKEKKGIMLSKKQLRTKRLLRIAEKIIKLQIVST